MAFSSLVLKPEPGLVLDHRAVTYKVKNVAAVPQLPHQSFERRTPTAGKLSASNAFHTCFRPRYLGRYVKRRQRTAAGPIGSHIGWTGDHYQPAQFGFRSPSHRAPIRAAEVAR